MATTNNKDPKDDSALGRFNRSLERISLPKEPVSTTSALDRLNRPLGSTREEPAPTISALDRFNRALGIVPETAQVRKDRPFPSPISVGGLFRAVRIPQQGLVYGPLMALAEARQGTRGLTAINLLKASKQASVQDLSGSDVLNEFGVTGKTATIGGLALDLIADPLWFFAPAKVLKLLHMPQALKLIKGTTAVQQAAHLIKEIPGVSRTLRFVTGTGKDPRYDRLVDDLQRAYSEGAEQALGSRSLGEAIKREPERVQRYLTDYLEAGAEIDPVKGKGFFLKMISPAQQGVLDRATSELGEATAARVADLGGKSVQMFADLGRKMVKAGLIPQKEFDDLAGKYIRYAYRIHEKGFDDWFAALPAQIQALASRGVQTQAGMRDVGTLGKLHMNFRTFLQRQDLTPEMREELGFILEAGLPIQKGELLSRRALATREFQQKVGKAFAQDLPQPGFTKVPNAKAEYGELANRFLPDAIVEDLLRTAKYPGLRKGLWKQGVSWWKFGKVVANPAAWARNIMSNFILADMAGLAPFKVHRFSQGIQSLRKKDRYYREAQKAGTFLTDTYVASEIGPVVADTASALSKNLTQAARQIGVNGTVPISARFRAGTKKLSDFYQWQEQVFKMAFFIDKRKAGVGAREASRLAEQALFNYRKVPELVDVLRTTGIAPFITFPFKAIPATGRALAKRPAVFNRYGHIFRSFEDRESADLRSDLPDYMRDTWMQVGKAKGKEVTYLNLGYILPFSDVAAVMGADPTHPRNRDTSWWLRTSQALLQRSPPAQIASTIITGQDAFTGKDLKTNDDWFQWAATTIMPPILPGGYSFRELRAAQKGVPLQPLSRRAKARTLTEAALASFAGIRLRTLNMSEEQSWRAWELVQDARELRYELNSLAGAQGNMDEDDRQEQMREVSERLRVLSNPGEYGPED
jgi:hypothetical protein